MVKNTAFQVLYWITLHYISQCLILPLCLLHTFSNSTLFNNYICDAGHYGVRLTQNVVHVHGMMNRR